MIEIEKELHNALQYEIAVELLREVDATISDETIKRVYEHCGGNAFNAPIMYELLKMGGQL